jgi:hypothetical protein
MKTLRPALALAAAAMIGTLPVAPAAATQSPDSRPDAAAMRTTGEPSVAYADLVDLTLAGPVIADATIRSTTRIKGAEATGVAPGRQRLYIEADVTALVRGQAGLPPRIGYLFDALLDDRGRAPKLKKERVLIFARPVANLVDQVQLSAPDAMLPWSPATDARVRAIARAAVEADAPPAIVGIGNAFHVPGALPGEGETQIFLLAAGGRPVSLSILRRPGEQPRWAVALSEIVDEAAGPPARETLLWYRLACGLPRDLPASATAKLDPADATVATEDYRFVLTQLGECGRQRSAITPAG